MLKICDSVLLAKRPRKNVKRSHHPSQHLDFGAVDSSINSPYMPKGTPQKSRGASPEPCGRKQDALTGRQSVR